MFEVYRDIPAKHKISTEGCENKTSSASQTTLSWNSIEGRFYRDSNGKINIYDFFASVYEIVTIAIIQLGKFAEDLDVARRLEAGEAENDEVMQEKVAALLENERLKEDLISKTEEKEKLAAKVKEMRDAARDAKGAMKEGDALLQTTSKV